MSAPKYFPSQCTMNVYVYKNKTKYIHSLYPLILYQVNILFPGRQIPSLLRKMFTGFFLIFIKIFIGCSWPSLLPRLLSTYGEQGQLSSCGAQASRFSGFFVAEHGFQGSWASIVWHVGSVVVVHGLVAPQHVESFQTRGWTPISCIVR